MTRQTELSAQSQPVGSYEELPPSSNWQTIIVVLRETSRHLPLLLGACLALLCGVSVNLAIPQILRSLIEGGAGLSSTDQFALDRFFPLFGLLIFQGLCFYFRSLLFVSLGLRVVLAIRTRLFSSLLAKPLGFYDAHTSGQLLSRVFNDVESIYQLISMRASIFIRYSLQVVGGIGFMLWLSFELSLLLLVCIPILVGTGFWLGRRLKRHSKLLQERMATAQSLAEESFSLIRVVRAFLAEGFESTRFKSAVDAHYETALDRAKLSAFFSSFVNFLLYLSLLIVVSFGLYSVNQGNLAPGDLTAFLLYGGIVGISFAFLSSSIAETIQALGACERAFSWLDTTSQQEVIDPEITKRDRLRWDSIEFQNVSFHFPSRPAQEVLTDFSSSIPANSRVGIVGRSGAGKSTVLQLMMEFYPVNSGSVIFHGSSEARPRFAYVPQETQLFTATLRENLCYGSTLKDKSKLLSMIAAFDLAELLESLPDGLDTVVGPRGLHLSGGQRQRIAIIRALLFEPEVLLLDEATSALDRDNEARVIRTLASLEPRPGIILVTHRLDLLSEFDRILVLESGRMVQSGSFKELANSEGPFQNQYNQSNSRESKDLDSSLESAGHP